ncbi:GspE/PulE family protein [Allopusillimonas ginsengisoli]|uniref:GspE/PulE family protein n=1 Tax=Allopusillimonas ginsengisoli TaxID=453575 RepID=UPI0039C31D14
MSGLPLLFVSTTGRDSKGVEMLNQLFWMASEEGVSDIQLRFCEDTKTVKIMQVDDSSVRPFGPWGDITDATIYDVFDSRIRSRASIDASIKQRDVDGRIRLMYRKEKGWPADRTLDLRLSIIPTIAGQTHVLRIQDAASSLMSLDDITMHRAMRNIFDSLLRERQGLCAVCGPTGSGKTTLLNSILMEFKRRGKNIKTVEHPVEYVIDGFDQINVTDQMSFARSARAFMRQRPHVILVGEVRDTETALAVMQLANTGHLVFFTVHSDDAHGIIKRLVELGIPRDSIAQSLKLVIAQRLLPVYGKNMPDVECQPPSDLDKAWLRAAGSYDPTDKFMPVPLDSDEFRLPLFETIRVTPDVRNVIRESSNFLDIAVAASRQPQYETLAEYAIRLARQGKAPLSAVRHLIGETVIRVPSERIDKLLIKAGALTHAQAHEVIEHQAEKLHAGEVCLMWQSVIDLGYASLEQVIDAVGKTSDAHVRLGYFFENERLSQEQADQIVADWKATNRATSIFKIAIKHKLLTHEEIYVKEILYYIAPGLSPLY